MAVCPLISMADPLKRIGDYPKCPETKCAWWVENRSKCFVIAIVELFEVNNISDSLHKIAEAFGAVRFALEPYSVSNNIIVQAIEAIGALGTFVNDHSDTLGTVAENLMEVLRDKRLQVDEAKSRREHQRKDRERSGADATAGDQ